MKYPTMEWGTMEAVINKLGGMDGVRRFLAGELSVTVGHSPDKFFQTRDGLWVSDGFVNLMVAKVGAGGQIVATKNTTLERGMTDAQIEKVLGDGHLFTEGDLLATLERMIQSQWGGKAGPLLSNGYANLFYTSSCVVFVYWYAVNGEWDVFTWQRGVNEWGAGYQVFSPATSSK